MFVKTDADLRACVQNGKPCYLLMGWYPEEERKAMGYETMHCRCQIGYECGRGMCFRYEAAPQEETTPKE